MMLTEADTRMIRSDGGRALLERASHMKDGWAPVGNANMGELLRMVKRGLIDGDGITPAGEAARARYHGG